MKQTKKQFNYGRDTMNPKLDAGLAERLRRIFWTSPSGKDGWKNVATAVRKIVKEAKEGE